MKHKPTVIVDACSYIFLNLSPSSLGGLNLWEMLRRHARTTWSPEVSAEINHSPNANPQTALTLHNNVHKFKKMSVEEYEQKLFGRILSRQEGDKGERDNFVVGLDMFFDGHNSIIYLSDDKNTDLQNTFFPAFPLFQVWDSFDVIVYLYLKENKSKFTKQAALDAVQDLVAHFRNRAFHPLEIEYQRGRLSKDMLNERKSQLSGEFNKKKALYSNRIELIFNFLKN